MYLVYLPSAGGVGGFVGFGVVTFGVVGFLVGFGFCASTARSENEETQTHSSFTERFPDTSRFLLKSTKTAVVLNWWIYLQAES